MQASDNRVQDGQAAQDVPPKVYAMLALQDEEEEAYVEDAQTVYLTVNVLTRVYLLAGHFTDADLRAWCLGMQSGHVTPIKAKFKIFELSDDAWQGMSEYITHGWAMITQAGYAEIALAVAAARSGYHAQAYSIMDLHRQKEARIKAFGA